MDDLVSLREIAEELAMNKSNARRYAIARGFVFTRARDSVSGRHQSVIALSRSDVQRLIELRRAEGFPVKGETEKVRMIKR